VLGAIVKVIQDQPNPKLTELLIAALKDPEAIIRAEAASGLGQVNIVAALPDLVLACSDVDVNVRKAAVSAIGKVGDASSMPTLQAALNDPEAVVKVLAKVAIGLLERRSADDDWD
jgi:bilin biosynthesis protein